MAQRGEFSGNFGSVYKYSPSTQAFTFLATVDGGASGQRPGNLIMDAAGDLFGSTDDGGANSVYGTFFEIPISGGLTTELSFDYTSGSHTGSFVADSAGNLYAAASLANGGTGSIIELAGTGFVVPEPHVALVGVIALLGFSRLRSRTPIVPLRQTLSASPGD